MNRRYSSSSITKKKSINDELLNTNRYRNKSMSKSYQESECNVSPNNNNNNTILQPQEQKSSKYDLTQTGLEDYNQSVVCNHQKQSSYAQSEGYHSYVSSSDSTPFLDRLRQESQPPLQSRVFNWFQNFHPQSTDLNMNSSFSSSTNIREETNSSTETLKWLGSMSDISVVSQATNTSNLSGSSQLIAHSSKVYTPQRQNSESILYMSDENKMKLANSNEKIQSHESFTHRSSRSDNRLFPISTYTEKSPILQQQTSFEQKPSNAVDCDDNNQNHDQHKNNLTYFDPSKTNAIPNSALKALQKNAVQSYFERQQQQMIRQSKNYGNRSDEIRKSLPIEGKRSSLNLSAAPSLNSLTLTPSNASQSSTSNSEVINNNNNIDITKTSYVHEKQMSDVSINGKTYMSFCEIKTENYTGLPYKGNMKNSSADENNTDNNIQPPPLLPRKNCILRRTSSASEYSSFRDKILHQNQHLSKDLLAPMILGKIISIDDWVPERPPKPKSSSNKNLSLRIPSPEMPPFPPPSLSSADIEIVNQNMNNSNNNMLPLPPSSLDILRQECEKKLSISASRRNSFAGQSTYSSKTMNGNMPLSPPAVPMRPKIVPTPIMTINSLNNQMYKPISVQNINSAHEVFSQEVNEMPQMNNQHNNNSNDTRVLARKRTHNSLSKDNMRSENQHLRTPPPPLKPRLRIHNEHNHNNNNNTHMQSPPIVCTKPRKNLKASYLPRQQQEDSDRGNYKMTLDEMDDNIQINYQNEINCNLPDVLPINVKYQNSYRQSFNTHQPRYWPTPEFQSTPHTAPVFNRTPVKSIFNFPMGSSNCSTPSRSSLESPSSTSSSLSSSHFTNGSRKSSSSSLQSPKYTSQSTIDLKMTKVIDPKLYTNDELIKAYHDQKEAFKEFNRTLLTGSLQTLPSVSESDNKIAVVRKLNMVETTSVESLEEKSMSEKSEKEIKIENKEKDEQEENNNNDDDDDEEEVVEVQDAEPIMNELTPKMVQKTEIVLKVSPSMQEIACQTEPTDCVIANHKNDESLDTTPIKMKHSEEIDFENLSKDLASQLSPSDKLHNILVPKTIKSTSDYISDLFKINVTSRPTKKDVSTSTLEKTTMKNSMELLTSNSIYFSTSEPKAKLMTRYSREMTLITNDSSNLTKKKEELIDRLGKKLKILENEQTMLAEESTVNDNLGHEVAFKVAQKLKPADSTKYRSHVDDVGYITMLLLSLSGRLARIENALHAINEKNGDKKILESKRDRLLEQLDEAKQLKEDIDRRGSNLSKILQEALTGDEYADYDYFINMKAKLIVDSREIADKIKLGEEQLNALKETLIHSEC